MLRININCVRSSVGKSFSLFFFVADFLIGENTSVRSYFKNPAFVCLSPLSGWQDKRNRSQEIHSSTKFFFFFWYMFYSFPFHPSKNWTFTQFHSFAYCALFASRVYLLNVTVRRVCLDSGGAAKPERIVAMRPKRNMINERYSHTISQNYLQK